MQNRSQTTYPGLNNKPCTEPKYYCRSHQVFLSDEDVATKKCMCKPTFDMLSTHPCKWLMTIEEYENSKANRHKSVKHVSSEPPKKMNLCKYWTDDGSSAGFCTYHNRPCNPVKCHGSLIS